MGLWLRAQPHAVTFRVQMPDPAMEAVVEVEGQVHAMETGPWGAREATVLVDGSGKDSAPFSLSSSITSWHFCRSCTCFFGASLSTFLSAREMKTLSV